MRYDARLELSKLAQWNIVGDEDKPYIPKGDKGGKRRPFGPRDRFDNHGFTEEELRLINKTRPKLARILDRSPWNFRLHFFVLPYKKSKFGRKKTYFVEDEREITLLDAKKAFSDYGEPFPENWKDSINIIMTGSFFNEGTGGRNMAPTPWIVMHNMAHGLKHQGYFQEYQRAFNFLFQQVYQGYLQQKDRRVSNMVRFSRVVETMFDFKSARQGRLRNFSEAMYEIFTSFMHNGGKLKGLNLPPAAIKTRSRTLYLHEDMNGELALDYIEDRVGEFKWRMEEASRESLNKSVGKWFVS